MRSRLVLPEHVQALKLMVNDDGDGDDDDDEGLELEFAMDDEEDDVVANLQRVLLGGRNGMFGTRAVTVAVL